MIATLDIIYEDADLRVFNKPANISLLADRQSDENLWDVIKSLGEKPYLVHRLDKGTSGVLLVARNQATQRRLTRAFAARQVHKYYAARVVGQFTAGRTFTIDLPLCKGRKSRYRIAAERAAIHLQGSTYTARQTRDGVPALTRVRCLQHHAAHSDLLVQPVTGRTHQIRVHLSWIGHALVGDHLYGNRSDPAQQGPRLLLHCHRIVVPEIGCFSAVADFPSDAG